MSQVGSESNPLRVAIIGAGPAGFYTVSNLLKQKDLYVEMDMFDRLPTPYGLVRAGVAPDHQKYKTVTRVYDAHANNVNYRFYGGVEYGNHVDLSDLKRLYHQIVFTTGAQTDRAMGIPGEDLEGSHSATDFVAWYNGHPDYANLKFDFSGDAAAIVGIGNVAVDVARLLCKTREELLETDMADYAIDALSESNIKEVYLLGRRGPVQAAFSPPEIKEVGKLADASVRVLPDEAELDPFSQEELDESTDRNKKKNVEVIQEFAARAPESKSKRLTIRFLVSPTEVIGKDGRVSALKIVRNKLAKGDDGSVRPRPTEEFETLQAGLVFRSVGYLGVPVKDIPFDDWYGTIRNANGRILTGEDGDPIDGLYTAGWIKRGPTGVIGTNKTCAQETVGCMLEDLQAGILNNPDDPDVGAARELVGDRQPRFFSFEDWKAIDAEEVSRGEASGRPRVKMTDLDEMQALLGR